MAGTVAAPAGPILVFHRGAYAHSVGLVKERCPESSRCISILEEASGLGTGILLHVSADNYC